jgi:hypothetical protein
VFFLVKKNKQKRKDEKEKRRKNMLPGNKENNYDLDN